MEWGKKYDINLQKCSSVEVYGNRTWRQSNKVRHFKHFKGC